jgi:TonB family protein
MLHALEDEPEEKGRWGRLGLGTAIAVVVAGGMLYGAQHFAPTRKLLTRVVQMTIMAPLPEQKQVPLPPIPTPPPKSAPREAKKDPGPKQAVRPDPSPQAADPQEVGLDAQSFGEGGDGPGFRVGGNQMGDPAAFAAAVKPEPVAVAAPVARQRLTFARALRQDPPATFSERARKLGIEGLMIFELDIDELGRVKNARIRKGLEARVDQEMLALVRRWTFQPALRGNRSVPTTQLFRYRYRFER